MRGLKRGSWQKMKQSRMLNKAKLAGIFSVIKDHLKGMPFKHRYVIQAISNVNNTLNFKCLL